MSGHGETKSVPHVETGTGTLGFYLGRNFRKNYMKLTAQVDIGYNFERVERNFSRTRFRLAYLRRHCHSPQTER